MVLNMYLYIMSLKVPEPPKPEEPVAHPTKAKVTSSTPERPLAQGSSS